MDDEQSAGGKKRGAKPRRFESALQEIEQIVSSLEMGQLDLDEALSQYQQGIKTLQECQRLLAQAERKITLLSGFDAEGNAVEAEFDEAEMSLDEKQSQRTSRRTAAGSSRRSGQSLGSGQSASSGRSSASGRSSTSGETVSGGGSASLFE